MTFFLERYLKAKRDLVSIREEVIKMKIENENIKLLLEDLKEEKTDD